MQGVASIMRFSDNHGDTQHLPCSKEGQQGDGFETVHPSFGRLLERHSGHQGIGICDDDRERFFNYIILQTYDARLHSRKHPMEFDAGTRPFELFDALSSESRRRREWRVCVCVCVFTGVIWNIKYIVSIYIYKLFHSVSSRFEDTSINHCYLASWMS